MQLTDKQSLKQKQSLAQKQSPQRLWLSFIITLFIFASSVSAYFLVKNSQDIRRSAAEPYSQCTCLYVSDCSVAGMKPCSGSCSPACSGPTSCCQPITSDLCTKGERYCVNNNNLAVCKSDRSGYTITACAAGKSCDPTTKTCIVQATPTTSPTNCAATNQSCQSKACCNSSDVCETVYGGKFCVSKGTACTSGQQKCAQEGSASYVYTCSSGGYWQKNKACDFGCSGTTCKSACTPGAKRCSGNAIETCNASGAAWSKQSCPSNSICNSQTLTCVNTNPTCQGTCYTNSSCTAIGKAPATGTCINETSVCCVELEEEMIPCGLSQTLCKRQNCVVMPGTVAQFCSDTNQAEVNEQYVEGVLEGSTVVLGTAASIAIGFIPVVGPVVQIASAVNQGIQAYYTCGQLAEIRNEPGISQEIKDQFSRACITSSISAATGFIGGGSSVVSQVAGSTLSATSQLTLTGLGMVDNFGNLTVSSMNANNLCKLYGTSSNECYRALANMGIAIGSTGLSLYSFNNQFLNYQNQIKPITTVQLQDETVIIPDSHSDLKSLQAYLRQEGVIDAYGNPTGKRLIVLGDMFGKSTNQLVGESPSGTPGIDVANYLFDLQKKLPDTIIVSGNWEPRTALAVAAQDMEYTETVNKLVNNKGVSRAEIDALIANRSLTRAQMAQLAYVAYHPDGGLVQHADTANLVRYALTEQNISTLLGSPDPATQQLAIDFINIQSQSDVVSLQNIAKIQEAIDQLSLTPQQVVNNINYNAQSIMDNALGIGQMENVAPGSAAYWAQVQMYNDLDNFHNQISAELQFFEPGGSNVVKQLGSMFGVDTIHFGHTPTRSLPEITLDSNLNLTYTQSGATGVFQNTGMTIMDYDINLSRGMNIPLTNPDHPKGFWPRLDGVIQVPFEYWLGISPIINN